MVKRVARQLLGETTVGMIDYYRRPERKYIWGGAFNGQSARQVLVSELVVNLRPDAIVETGTYLGTTTEFLAQTGLPVYTIEADQRNYGFARARFWRTQNVTLFYGDSRAALRKLFDWPLREMVRRTLFFYLDAHWDADLPLAEELEIVFSRCPAAIVMLDDFEVPLDPGYGYDDYGPGKVLTASYIAPVVSKHQLQTFYPTTRSIDESGLRRGCVVLAKESVHGRALSSIPLLHLVGKTEPAFSDFED
jgi:hypothetical protein